MDVGASECVAVGASEGVDVGASECVADGASEGVADGASEGEAIGASEGVDVGASEAQVSPSPRPQQPIVPHGATRSLPTLTEQALTSQRALGNVPVILLP